MNSSVGSQAEIQSSRKLIESLELQFARLDKRTRDLVQRVPVAVLYHSPKPGASSVGELILRSAGVVEQTCGGLTANLWDDPFEWTLPETLSTPTLITEYLNEVVQTRNGFFARLHTDGDLAKLIAVPAGDTQPLIQILLETLLRAAGYLERATVILAGPSDAIHE